MTGYRLTSGGLIDRGRPFGFTFDGTRYQGFAGDTLASALLAAGVTLFGRSFKYHRPRGLFSAGVEEPNALVTLRDGARQEPNCKATLVELYEGLEAASQNRWPSLNVDAMAVNGLAGPLFAAGFYYKTFMGPTRKAWMIYEHFIRKAAGMGAGTLLPDPDRYETVNAFCDLLVVGGGPAGLVAALVAGRAGARVVLADEAANPGGSLYGDPQLLDDGTAHDWTQSLLAELMALPNVTVMTRTTVYGYYDDNTLGAVERVADHLAVPGDFVPRQRHWTLRARQVILATGALERPIVFAGNDTPGVMLAEAARTYVNRFAVAPGCHAALFVNNDAAYRTAETLAAAGVDVVAIVDPRAEPSARAVEIARNADAELLSGHAVIRARGGKALRRIEVAPFDLAGGTPSGPPGALDVDLLAVSGGWTPTVHLHSQAGGKPVWDESLAAFLPGEATQAWRTAGACAGQMMLADCLTAAARVAGEALQALGRDPAPMALPQAAGAAPSLVGSPIWQVPALPRHDGKAFVDLQHDVTVDDVRLAHREGFRSVEHLKRYTTLGMATDQGKTSNVNGLAVMAEAAGKSIPQVGTTRFRPPYTPVSLGALVGRAVAAHYRPLRRTPMHDWHVAHNGEMMAVGLWQRPRAYLRAGETVTEAYVREARQVRESVGLVDVSTLGKIQVQGPDAAELLNRVYINGFAKLPVGKARYGIMLREDGFVFDDGTSWRLGEHDFLMTTTTANAAAVMSHLEFCLDVLWPELRVQITSVTDQWAAMALSGPNSRAVLEAALDDIDVSNEALPFMGVRRGHLAGVPVMVSRLSFSGELAYEVYAPAHYGLPVWRRLLAVGQGFDIIPYGLEALGTLRIEKGHVAGPELDGRTTAEDLGLGGMASGKKHYIGRPMMAREGLVDAKRLKLVGLRSRDGQPVRAGAHLVEGDDPAQPGRSLGHVTSMTYSPATESYVALGLLEGGRDRLGEQLYATFPLRNQHVPVEVVAPCFFDPEGSRMHV